MRIPLLRAAVASLVVALAPAVALAHGDDGAASGPKPRRSRIAHAGGSQLPAETPPAPAGDGATAQGIVRDLEAQGAKDAELAKVVAEPVKTAKRALERAHGARAAGDEQHARMLDALALGWAEAGKSLIRAAEAERVATAVAKKALEVQTRVERARALLEETQARRERAAAELVKVEADAKEAKARAADAESQRMDVAKQRGNKGAAPPAAKAKAPKGAK